MSEATGKEIGAAEVHCGRCGAPATWDPASTGLKCGSCGAVTRIDAPGPRGGHSLEDASRRWPARPRRPGSRHIACGECGAVVDTAPGALTATCPFCGSDAVAEAPDDGKTFPPDAVVPFSVDREVATQNYRAWLGALWFRPSALRRRAHVESLTPVYVPFWAFDFDATTEWGADWQRYETETMPDGSLRRRLSIWQRATGEVDTPGRGVLAHGSTGLAEPMWRGLEPFPVGDAAGYDGRFLAGFAAEAARDQPLEAWQQVRARTEKRVRIEAEVQVPGDRHRAVSLRTSYEQVSFRQTLLPIWVAAYRYRGRVFRFLVNGATGTVSGRAPWSWLKIATAAAIVAGFLGAGIYSAASGLFAGNRARAAATRPRTGRLQVVGPAERARALGLRPVHGNGAPLRVKAFVPRRGDRSQGSPPAKVPPAFRGRGPPR